MIKLFELQNGKIIPTEHCYVNETLRRIQDIYPDEYMKVYAYLFYMTCPNPDLNPYFNIQDFEKDEIIMSQLVPETFSSDESDIVAAIEFCKKLYETPTLRAYTGIKNMLDNLATYMRDTAIEHGRDGNITAIVNAAAKFEQIRLSFKGTYKDLMEEQASRVRGGGNLAYDQS